ncbi:TauD/TfdA family dioxygenase [Pseudoalteromonas sp. OANN1]|uniref:TauD/TfdA family dioxygenase n=1 Tax=Pseudoalteromonas sp. OANN1 TaxID=2954497 RepID=UPI0020973405|nr:TauD/TfdA family dioxygenase [Pseudoalteromonas sp. OANN1]MCO7199088.1 TauD/TfdA family dioxygenase [Pseudoalteromonas sp. OANN1]
MTTQLNITENVMDVQGNALLLNVDQAEMTLKDWAATHVDEIETWLATQGALLLRGLRISSSRQFGQLLETLFGEPLISYSHRSTPRTELRGNVYTATEYHSDQLIQQHNEQAYTNIWPMRLGFFSMLPAEHGGETPIADSREIYRRIPESIRDNFAKKGVMYVRNFSNVDLPWQEVFCTEDRSEVEKYCLENEVQLEWIGDNGLRIKQILPAVCKHPVSNETLWFNQAHLFHVSTLEPELKSALLSSFGIENLPRNTYYGDGTPIEDEVIDTIRTVYEESKISFAWQKGDLMLLDNMLYSHGRMPFSGERQTLVGMTRPFNVLDTIKTK